MGRDGRRRVKFQCTAVDAVYMDMLTFTAGARLSRRRARVVTNCGSTVLRGAFASAREV